MTSAVKFRFAVPAAALLALAVTPAPAQRLPSPEQRIERLERQLMQVQRRVFPQGQPASTAGFPFEPAATQASVSNLDNRLMALERQMAEILRHAEENGHRVTVLEAELAKLRNDQDDRLRGLERAVAAAAARPQPVETAAAEPAESEASSTPPLQTASASSTATPVLPETDPAEEAYDVGYELWRAGKYDEAVTALRAFASSFPNHRRASWANNLAGRALLDKGEAFAAAEALLANYRSNPKGERAADSLYYLGQALMKLDQPSRACNAYAELEAVYGDRMRDALKEMLPAAKAEAKCG
jgi:TolA-binding protein